MQGSGRVKKEKRPVLVGDAALGTGLARRTGTPVSFAYPITSTPNSGEPTTTPRLGLGKGKGKGKFQVPIRARIKILRENIHVRLSIRECE